MKNATVVIRNDAILAWRRIGGPGTPSASRVLIATFIVVAHLFAHFVIQQIELLPPELIDAQGPRALTLALVVASLWAFSTALSKSADSLANRPELAFFLSSPVSARQLFLARFVAICINAGALSAIVLFPLANVAAFSGRVEWLGIYLVIAAIATVASAMAMALASMAFIALGVGVGRTVIKTVSILAAVFMLLAVVAPIPLGVDAFHGWFVQYVTPRLATGAAFGPESVVWFLGRAVFGDVRSLVGTLMLAIVGGSLTALLLSEAYYRLAREVESSQVSRVRGAEEVHWPTGLMVNVVLREWRCIVRDPKLLGDILFQAVLLLIPVLVGVQWLVGQQGIALDYVYPAVVAFAASVAGSLAWIALSTDEAPTLMAASPYGRRARLLKLTASLLPLWILLFPVMLAGSVVDVRRGGSMFVVAYSATISVGVMNIWQARPAKRSDLNRRGAGTDSLGRVLEMLAVVAWGAVAYGLALNATVALTGGLVVLGTMVLARLMPNASS